MRNSRAACSSTHETIWGKTCLIFLPWLFPEKARQSHWWSVCPFFCKANYHQCFKGSREHCLSFSSSAYLLELNSQRNWAVRQCASQETSLSIFCRNLFSAFIDVQIRVWDITQPFFPNYLCYFNSFSICHIEFHRFCLDPFEWQIAGFC